MDRSQEDRTVAGETLLQEGDGARVLDEWNRTETPFPSACAHELFELQVERTPNATAVAFEGRTLTYRELNERANQVGHFLRGHGVGPDALVGVCLSRSPELVVALLGVWKAGGAYVPLDPSYPTARIARMVEDAGVTVLLTSDGCKSLLPKEGPPRACIDTDWPELGAHSTANAASAVSPAHLAYVMYTSGSTGTPKGAMITHSGLVNYLSWAIAMYGVEAGDSVPVHSSVAFDLTVTSLYPALLVGGCVELLGEDRGAGNLLDALRRRPHRAIVKITPAHLDLLTAALRPEEVAGLAKTWVIGGENLPAESLSFLRDFAPESRLINEYGPTETVVGCCVYEVGPGDPSHGPVPIGRPIANTQLYVLSPSLEPTAVGVVGELFIGGAGVARGYLRRPELTLARFIPDPFSRREGARLYRTGDLARYRPDGNLEYLGRKDDQVKVRGYRIELGEVEAAISAHPKVRSAVVVLREDAPGDKQLVAYVVEREGAPLAKAELLAFARERLPEYMVPAHVIFLPELPLTVNGKVDRAALPRPVAEAEVAAPWTAPRDETERAIAAIWSRLLNVPNISAVADFFQLGGHSLLAIKALAQIRAELGANLPLETLFEHSTVEALAVRVKASRGVTKEPPISTVVPPEVRLPDELSSAQRRLWLFDQMVPNSSAYTIVDFIPLPGAYSAAALTAAVTEMVARHETLRTVFARGERHVAPQVLAPFTPTVREHDVSLLPATQQRDEWTCIVREQAAAPFDLTTGPLFRVSAVHLSDEHRALVTIHHIVADEWSMEVIHEELTALYAAFRRGDRSPLPRLSMQYAEFARQERELLEGEGLALHRAYWKAALAGAPPVLTLPTDRPRPDTASMLGDTECFAVPGEVVVRLSEIATRHRATMFMALAAAFSALLARYSGQDDILVSTPISARKQAEMQRLIGCFLNVVVLRSRIADDTTFETLLDQTRERALEAHGHAGLPFEQVVADLGVERHPSRPPLCQVMFILHGRDGVSQVSRVAANHELSTKTSKLDLTLAMSESGGSLDGLFEYSTDLFDKETIQQLCRSFVALLHAATQQPSTRLSALSIVSEQDRQTLAVDWNRTATDFPLGRLRLHELFEHQAAAEPLRIAVECGGESLTYAELDRRASAVGHRLRMAGAAPDVLVGILVDRSLEMLVGLLGILKSGAAYVPLDPSFPPERLAYMIEQSRMTLLVTHRDIEQMLSWRPPTVVRLDEQMPAPPVLEDAVDPRREPASDGLAYVLYTSGSTGTPKGVAICHSAIVNCLLSMQRVPGMSPGDTLLAVTTLSFDIAALELFLPLITGAKVVIASRADVLEPKRVMALLRDLNVTVLQATPATWRALLDAGWKGSPSLKALCGGETLGHDLSRALVGRCRELWNMYGPTETTVWSSVHQVTRADTTVPIGRPIANTEMYVLDGSMGLLPAGVPGELYIGGRGVARGYLHAPELTRARFVPNPFAEGTRLYRTGDLARWRASGELDCLGRTDHQVKLRGYRIELGEIESRLLRHDSVRDAVVVAREDRPGEKRLVAYVVVSGPSPTLMFDLRTQLRSELPDYMVPAHIVPLSALPRTPNGKIDRKALPAPAGEDVVLRDRSYAAPTTELETCLVVIWERLLGVPRVGIHDNFFELGGTSLSVLNLMVEMERATGLTMSLGKMFAAPTIAGLIASLGRTASDEASMVIPLQPEGDGLPIFCLCGVSLYQEFARSLGTAQPVFGVYVAEEDSLAKRALLGEKLEVSISDLASSYYDAIVRAAPHGPYRLAGSSFGGIVAVVVASMLRKQGEDVEFVAMLDTLSPRAIHRNWKSWAVRRATQLVTGEAVSRIRRDVSRWKDGLVARGVLHGTRTPEDIARRAWNAKQMAYFSAVNSWVARTVMDDFPVILFRASEQHWGEHNELLPDYGWHYYLRKPVSIVPVHGDHLGILKSPDVSELGRKFQATLAAAVH